MSWLKADVSFETDAFSLSVSFELEGRMAVMGPPGAGKTLLLRLLAGLTTPTAGTIECGGKVWLDQRRNIPTHRRRVGFVHQPAALFPHLSVGANVGYGSSKRVDELLTRFGLIDIASKRSYELTADQAQRVALARAIASEPALLLLDDPVPKARAEEREDFLELLQKELQAVHVPVVIVMDRLSEAAAIAPRIVAMERGTVVQDATPLEMKEAPGSLFVRHLSQGLRN